MRRKCLMVFVTLFLTVIAIFLYVEMQTQSVVSSSVYQNEKQTEIQMYVVMNTFLSINEDKILEEIIMEHQKINGVHNYTVYTLRLYRTMFHYRRNWEYDTIICDEKGAIICCGENLEV